MSRRFRIRRARRALAPLLAPFLVLLVAAPAAAQDEDPGAEEATAPLLSVGTGTLSVDGRSVPFAISRTAIGPLVELAPVVGSLGGQLTPIEGTTAWILEIQGTRAVLGTNSQAVTVGEEIWSLSQTPRAVGVRVLIPVDLLQRLYGSLLGWSFEWRNDSATLVARRGARREIPLTVSAVQLQGLTTLVLEFATPPRYNIDKQAAAVRVDLVGDAVQLTARPELPVGSLVSRLEVRPDRILLQLAPNTRVDDYVLSEPFRLVFDVYAEAPATEPEQRAPVTPRDLPGVHTIVLDPGHGGPETGAIGAGGSQEKELTLLLARELERLLEARLPVDALLTRNRDEGLGLDERSAYANANKADVFVSLHLNSTRGGSAHGAETYFLSLTASDEAAAAAAARENRAGGQASEASADLELILWDLAQSRHLSESQRLAKLIQAELNRSLGLRDRGVKQAPFRVLKGAAMPAVLVELGFINNPADEERLNDPEYRSRLIEALVRAIERFRATQEEPISRGGAEAAP